MVTLAPNIVDAATVLLGAHPAVNQVEVRMKGSELHFLSISAHCNESLQYIHIPVKFGFNAIFAFALAFQI